MKYLSIRTQLLAGFLLIFFGIQLTAQDISSSIISNPDLTFCKPGVCNKSPGKGLLIDYRLQPSFNYSNADASGKVNYNSRFTSKIKIPFVIKPGLKMLLGFNYAIEKYSFEDKNQIATSPLFQRLDNAILKTARISAYISKPLNQKFYTTFKFDALYSGDYQGFMKFNDRYAAYRGVGIFGYKKSDHVEYGIGLLASKSFRNSAVYPFGFYNRTFNDKWGIELAIPLMIKVRRNFNNKCLLLFGPEYSSRSYSIDVGKEETTIFHFRRHAIELSGVFMYNIKGWAWIQGKAGYVNNLRSSIRDTNLNSNFKATPSDGFYMSIGFFLSPPVKR